MVKTEGFDTLIAAAYKESEYPVCRHQALEWNESKPFEGLTVLDATPIFRNTLVKYKALLAAGANLIVGRAAGFPCDERIVQLLKDSGLKVVSSKEKQTEAVDFILDCAGSFSHWKARIGIVELTRSGVHKYTDSQSAVFVADSGRIKRIETCLGTGESYFRAMSHIGYSDWNGKKLVIFGSGKVGTGLLTYAKKYGAKAVVVTLLSSVTDKVQNLADELLDCTDTQAVVSTLGDAFAVVTATGIANALSPFSSALHDSPALLANMGVEDEYGDGMPAERVLCNKHTLNFILEEPTHLKYIDATMGLHNEGINYILSHANEQGLIIPPAELEDKLLCVTKERGCIGEELNSI